MTVRSWVRASALAAALAGAAQGGVAEAQLFWVPPDFSGAPVTGAEPGIIAPLPGATPAEDLAGLVWNLRAGLNVAALQCQFSPATRTVPLYNAILQQHDKEFDKAQLALAGYFKKKNPKDAKAAANTFDQYSTRTYNSFSTLHAQIGFCQTAGKIGRIAIATPKGGLQQVAIDYMREFRNSLIPAGDGLFVLDALQLAPPDVRTLDPSCYAADGSILSNKRKCRVS